MGFASAAQQTLATSHVHLSRDEIAFLDARDLISKSHHLDAKFVARDERRMDALLRPAVPLVNVQVGTADRRNLDLNQNVVASEGGNLHLSDLRARCSFCFYDCKHFVRHEPAL